MRAARELFFAAGVEDVGIEAIAARAGVSKVTVYARFGSKSEILSAVVNAEAAAMTSALNALPGDGRSLAERLVDFGVALLTFLTRPEILALERLITSQADRHPEMAQAMVEAGPRFGQRQVAAQIAKALPSDGVVIADATVAARHFMSLVQGQLQAECRLGVRAPPKRAEIERHVRDATALFLRGYARP